MAGPLPLQKHSVRSKAANFASGRSLMLLPGSSQ